jgi:phytanoyl-CoA hydroxylase
MVQAARFDVGAYPIIGDAERLFFAENGYLIVEGALPPAEVNELRRETTAICRGDLGAMRGLWPAEDESDERATKRF